MSVQSQNSSKINTKEEYFNYNAIVIKLLFFLGTQILSFDPSISNKTIMASLKGILYELTERLTKPWLHIVITITKKANIC